MNDDNFYALMGMLVFMSFTLLGVKMYFSYREQIKAFDTGYCEGMIVGSEMSHWIKCQ